MKPPTDRLHAYLFVASLSAILIQVAVFISILLLHVPERAFESSPFRVAVVAAIGCVLLVVRRQARRATREAESRNRSQAKLRATRAACASKRAARAPLRARHIRGAMTAAAARSSAR
ncbi:MULTISPECIES: hypothetical protein [Paraburkholderia]|uniref:hypothetical protein n=1 Tax=Paraburkholderia TaxID=1822464 RepID=UPI0004AEE936|nr:MULTISPECIES: hypothetical protein [Paraburkholderia]MCP3716024.1 hypothetical protein [Paraburkholderia sp. CNPSo 3281]